MTWSWATGTPRERAEMVRNHARSSTMMRAPHSKGARDMTHDDLRRLFHLTQSGLVEILSGADWNQRFSNAPSEIRRPSSSPENNPTRGDPES